MARISARPNDGNAHASLSHALDDNAIELGADAPILVVRMHGEQMNDALLSIVVQLICDKSSNRAIHLRDEYDGARCVCTIAPHLLALALPPVGVEDDIELWPEDVVD
jgi:hypothetical protein